MAHCLDAFRPFAISSPIWKPHHDYSEANLIFTRASPSPSPSSSSSAAMLQKRPLSGAASTAVMAMSSRSSRRWWWWWQGITSGKAACNVKAALCMRARASVSCKQVWERVEEEEGYELHTIDSAEKCTVRCASSVPALRWRLLWRKLRARINWMKSSCIACPRDRPLNDLLYDPVSYALNFDNGNYTAPYPPPPFIFPLASSPPSPLPSHVLL